MPHRAAKSGVTIREYRPGDDDSVYTLILSIHESEFRDLPPEGNYADLKDISHIYKEPNNEFFVAEAEGKIIGTVAIKQDDDKAALIRRLFVNPHWRGKSVGKALVAKALAFAKDRGYEQVRFLGHEKMKQVRGMLEKLGFKEEVDVILPGIEFIKLVCDLKR